MKERLINKDLVPEREVKDEGLETDLEALVERPFNPKPVVRLR